MVTLLLHPIASYCIKKFLISQTEADYAVMISYYSLTIAMLHLHCFNKQLCNYDHDAYVCVNIIIIIIIFKSLANPRPILNISQQARLVNKYNQTGLVEEDATKQQLINITRQAWLQRVYIAYKSISTEQLIFSFSISCTVSYQALTFCSNLAI